MKIRTILIILTAIVSFSCTEGLTSAVMEREGEDSRQKSSGAIVPGELIVEFSEAFAGQIEKESAQAMTKTLSGADVLNSLGITKIERLFTDGGEWEERHREAGLHRWYRVNYDPAQPATKAETNFGSLDFVESVESVRRIRPQGSFNDPELSKQWHYSNPGAGSFVKGADVNVIPVWENFTAGSSNVIVAVVDGGIQMDHPDLAGVVIPGGVNGSKNFVDGFTGYSISATTHGTHVAGTIAAINNNGIGCCGIAGGKDGNGGVRLLSCQIFTDRKDADGNDYGSDTYNAMVWGADHGAVISQNSWGYQYDSAEDAKNGSVGAMKAAIDYFIKNAGTDKNGNQLPDSPMKGGVVIFAAGNDGWPDGWPAEYGPVVAVGAMNAKMSRSSYSNYGSWVDICAPGGDSGIDPMIYSTLPGGRYGYLQGTSMACPHVSGVAALIVSHFGGPGFTNEMLLDRLLGGANSETALKNQKIGPLVDAYGSFMLGGTIPPDKPESFIVRSSANTLFFSWKVGADSDSPTGKAYAYLLLASENREDFDGLNPSKLPQSVHSSVVEVGALEIGGDIEGKIENLGFEKDYFVSIIAYDFSKNWSEQADIQKIRTKQNNAPEIHCTESGELEIKAFETRTVDFQIQDPDGHKFSVDYRSASNADSWKKTGDGNYRMTIVGKDAPAGTYTARISAQDNLGADSKTATFNLKYTILPNRSPLKIKDIENKIFSELGVSHTIDMAEYVTDPDGEILVYEFSHSNSSVSHINPVANVLTLTTLNYGVDEITIKASDALGEYCELAFKLCVSKASDGVSIYPTSVRDYLYVSSTLETEIVVEVVSSTGKKLYENKGRVSIFEPMKIDLTNFARGLYTVVVNSDAKTTKGVISKL